MNLPSIAGLGRVAASTEGAPASSASSVSSVSARPAADAPAVEVDQVSRQPVPLRFPWLSRLSQQLEAAARQRQSFAPAPQLGDHLDKSA